MSEQQLKAFLEQVKVDAGLQERLNGADPYAVFAIAQERGFMDSGDNLELVKPVLSESELESVAGGGGAWLNPSITNPKCTACIDPSPCG